MLTKKMNKNKTNSERLPAEKKKKIDICNLINYCFISSARLSFVFYKKRLVVMSSQ